LNGKLKIFLIYPPASTILSVSDMADSQWADMADCLFAATVL